MDKNIGCIYTRLVYSFSYLYNHRHISITENHNPFGMPPLTLSPTAHSAARDSCWAYMWLAGCSIFSRRQLASNLPLSRPCLRVSVSVPHPSPAARHWHLSFFFLRAARYWVADCSFFFLAGYSFVAYSSTPLSIAVLVAALSFLLTNFVVLGAARRCRAFDSS